MDYGGGLMWEAGNFASEFVFLCAIAIFVLRLGPAGGHALLVVGFAGFD